MNVQQERLLPEFHRMVMTHSPARNLSGTVLGQWRAELEHKPFSPRFLASGVHVLNSLKGW